MDHELEEFLAHYGVKGMRWGVRRPRGPNGLVVGKPMTKKEAKIRAKRDKVRANRRNLSDDDLKKHIERLQNEKKLKSLIDEDLNPGKTIAKRIMSESGQKVARTAVAGAGVYAVKVALERKFSPTEAAKYMAPKPKNK